MENFDFDQEKQAHDYETAQPAIIELSAIENTSKMIETIVLSVQDGYTNGLDAFVVFKRLESVFNDAKKKIEEYAQSEASNYQEKTFVVNGISITKKQGSEKLNYLEDHEVKELTEKLKQRQELVKLATKSKETIFDSNGIEVTKVSSKFDKDSLVIKF